MILEILKLLEPQPHLCHFQSLMVKYKVHLQLGCIVFHNVSSPKAKVPKIPFNSHTKCLTSQLYDTVTSTYLSFKLDWFVGSC